MLYGSVIVVLHGSVFVVLYGRVIMVIYGRVTIVLYGSVIIIVLYGSHHSAIWQCHHHSAIWQCHHGDVWQCHNHSAIWQCHHSAIWKCHHHMTVSRQLVTTTPQFRTLSFSLSLLTAIFTQQGGTDEHRKQLSRVTSKKSRVQYGTKNVRVLLLLQIVLLLTAVGCVTGRYHVYEEGENAQDVGYDSPGSLTGANFVGGRGVVGYGGAGGYVIHPTVKYVTPQVNSYGEPTGATYYGAGDYASVGYGGAIGEGHGDPTGRVRVQVRFKETQHVDYAQH